MASLKVPGQYLKSVRISISISLYTAIRPRGHFLAGVRCRARLAEKKRKR